jgi:hypothetical protein
MTGCYNTSESKWFVLERAYDHPSGVAPLGTPACAPRGRTSPLSKRA